MQTERYLQLDSLTTRPDLAQQLPSELAFRYHALPVAGRDGRMTIAIADPDDVSARTAIRAALGAMPYLIKGDRDAIDTLLAEVWQIPTHQQLHILVYDHPHHTLHTPEDLWEYVASLSEQLGANLVRTQSCTLPKDTELSGYDLVVMSKVKPVLAKLVTGPIETRIAYRLSTSLLVVHQSVWPLRKILLITRCNEIRRPALDWTLRLAKPSDTVVTQLLVTPDVPSIYHCCYIEALLSPSTEMGGWIRFANEQFAQRCISSDIKIRQGEPTRQVEQELTEKSYDLVIVMTNRANIGIQWSPEDKLINSIWEAANCPVLVAR